MTLNWIDRIGDWNPQLLRELKGRLKLRNVLLVVGLAILAQFLLFQYFWAQLPADNTPYYNQYCFFSQPGVSLSYENQCLKDALGQIRIDWSKWWLDLFRVLNWGISILLVMGVYMLIADLGQEERRGTLNFIRLSPQSSRSILLGKLLGTPILLYLGVLLFVPLHLFVAAKVEASGIFVASFYAVLVTSSCLLYSFALLCGFLGKLQSTGRQLGEGAAVVYMLLTLTMFFPGFISWNLVTVWSSFGKYLVSYSSGTSSLQWFYLPLGKSLIFSHAFTLLNLGMMTGWIWRSLQRCFHTPSATILSKQQSYGLVLYIEVLTLGFCLQDFEFSSSSDRLFLLTAACSVIFVTFLALIGILSHQRQTLLDWTRYRHMAAGQRQQNKRFFWLRSVALRDLIWGEKSPAVLAIVLNLLLAIAIIVPWILSWPENFSHERDLAFLGLLMTLNLIAIYAVIAQLMLLMKTPKRGIWAAGGVGLAILIPSITGAILSRTEPSSLLLLSPFLWIQVNSDVLPRMTTYLTILGEWLTFGMLSLTLTRQLNRLGESASKSLLTGTALPKI
jgi:hypothetical protein